MLHQLYLFAQGARAPATRLDLRLSDLANAGPSGCKRDLAISGHVINALAESGRMKIGSVSTLSAVRSDAAGPQLASWGPVRLGPNHQLKSVGSSLVRSRVLLVGAASEWDTRVSLATFSNTRKQSTRSGGRSGMLSRTFPHLASR